MIILSGHRMNRAPYALSLVVPLTTRIKNLPGHLFIAASDSGLRADSEIMCEHVRSISHRRFKSDAPIARIPTELVEAVLQQVRELMEP